MTSIEQQKFQKAIEETDAIFALEGFKPTKTRKLISDAIMAGRVTHAQVAHEMSEYATQHKTITGFVESRPWAI